MGSASGCAPAAIEVLCVKPNVVRHQSEDTNPPFIHFNQLVKIQLKNT